MRRNAGQGGEMASDQVGTGRTLSDTRFPWREAVLVETVGVRYYTPGALPSRSGQTRRASNESRGSEAQARDYPSGGAGKEAAGQTIVVGRNGNGPLVDKGSAASLRGRAGRVSAATVPVKFKSRHPHSFAATGLLDF